MPWRPLNDVIIIEPEGIQKYEGSIVMPQKNSEEKISPFGTIVSWGSKCKYSYKIGQRIKVPGVEYWDYRQPQYLISEGKKYRMIKEEEVFVIFE